MYEKVIGTRSSQQRHCALLTDIARDGPACSGRPRLDMLRADRRMSSIHRMPSTSALRKAVGTKPSATPTSKMDFMGTPLHEGCNAKGMRAHSQREASPGWWVSLRLCLTSSCGVPSSKTCACCGKPSDSGRWVSGVNSPPSKHA